MLLSIVRCCPLSHVHLFSLLPSCDFDWVFVVNRRHEITMPSSVQLYWDTLTTVGAYDTCKYNKKKYKGEVEVAHLYKLANLYRAMTGTQLDNAHEAFADARAGAVIAGNPELWKYRNKAKGVLPLSDLWEEKKAKADKEEAEINYTIHEPWVENQPGDATDPKFTGGNYGPQGSATDPCGKEDGIVALFLKFWTPKFLGKVAKETNRYGNEQTVKDKGSGKKGAKKEYERCARTDAGARTRFRSKNAKRKWIPVTRWFLLAFLAVLIRGGARRWRNKSEAWSTDYGLRDDDIASFMTQDAFDQLLRFIHFTNNDKVKPKSNGKIDPLVKVRPLLDHFRRVNQTLWTLGQEMTVDESMVKCKSRLVKITQYLPKKVRGCCSCLLHNILDFRLSLCP